MLIGYEPIWDWIRKEVKEEVREMTLEEVEKVLGYKIKIISSLE